MIKRWSTDARYMCMKRPVLFKDNTKTPSRLRGSHALIILPTLKACCAISNASCCLKRLTRSFVQLDTLNHLKHVLWNKRNCLWGKMACMLKRGNRRMYLKWQVWGFFGFFFLDDKTSAPHVSSSCLFIPSAHLETSLVMVSYYGYEIWRHRYFIYLPLTTNSIVYRNGNWIENFRKLVRQWGL